MESLNSPLVEFDKRVVCWSKSLYIKIFFGLALSLGVTVFSLRLIISNESKKHLKAQNKEYYIEITTQVMNHLISQTNNTKVLAQSLSNTSFYIEKDVEEYKRVFSRLIDHEHLKSVVIGGGIWPEPGVFQKGVERRSFFWGRNDRGKLKYYDNYNLSF